MFEFASQRGSGEACKAKVRTPVAASISAVAWTASVFMPSRHQKLLVAQPGLPVTSKPRKFHSAQDTDRTGIRTRTTSTVKRRVADARWAALTTNGSPSGTAAMARLTSAPV